MRDETAFLLTLDDMESSRRAGERYALAEERRILDAFLSPRPPGSALPQ